MESSESRDVDSSDKKLAKSTVATIIATALITSAVWWYLPDDPQDAACKRGLDSIMYDLVEFNRHEAAKLGLYFAPDFTQSTEWKKYSKSEEWQSYVRYSTSAMMYAHDICTQF